MVAAVSRIAARLGLRRGQWRAWRAAWPAVPARLWLTAAGAGLMGLSLWFSAELWPHHEISAIEWSWLGLGLLLGALAYQVQRYLWQCVRAYAGPWWRRWLLRLLLAGLLTGSLVVAALLGLVLLVLG